MNNIEELKLKYLEIKLLANDIMVGYNKIIHDTTMNSDQRISQLAITQRLHIYWYNATDSFLNCTTNILNTALNTNTGIAYEVYEMVSVIKFLGDHMQQLKATAFPM